MEKHIFYISLMFLSVSLVACNISATTEAPVSTLSLSTPSFTPIKTPTISSSPTIKPMLPLSPTSTITAVPFVDLLALYNYDQNQPLGITEVSTKQHDSITIQDISFASPFGERIRANLVIPAGEGPHPGILYVHWLGNINSNRDEFLEEAIGLAKEGAVCLLIDDLFASPEMRHRWTGTDPDEDRAIVIQQVIELRRAIDVLTSQNAVDAKRIAFVGHDFGGMFGAVLSGVDQRIKTYVLIAPNPDFSDWFLLDTTLSSDQKDKYKAYLFPVAPILYVGHMTGSFFFQFAREDGYVSKQEANDLFDAAHGPKEIEWYAFSHALQNDPKTTQDRLKWLHNELNIGDINT